MKKQFYLLSNFLFFLYGLHSQTNLGFEATPVGTYTSSNGVIGWTISSQTVTNSCNNSTSWTPGSSEFSIVATPILNYPIIGTIPNSPLGGNRVAILNDLTANTHATRISQTFAVGVTNSSFKFAFAGILQDASLGHNCCQQPNFKIEIYSNSGPAFCSNYTFAPSSTLCSTPSTNGTFSLTNNTYWTNWVVKTIDLTPYIGSTITVNFTVNDCTSGSHHASALFDAFMDTNLTLLNNTPYIILNGWVNYCAGSNQATFNAPLGYSTYQWYTSFPGQIAIPQATNSSLSVNTTSLFIGDIYSVYLTAPSGCAFTATYALAYTQVSINAIGSSPSCINGASGGTSIYAMGSGTGYNYTWLNATNSVVGTSSVLSNMPPGVYTVSVTALNASGCGSAVATTTISAAPTITSTILQPYCANVAYLNSPLPGSTFQWYNGSNLIPSGSGGTSQSYSVSNPVNGAIYSLSYMSGYGCQDSVAYILVNSNPGALSISGTHSLCPNDTTGFVTITLLPTFASPYGVNSFSVFSTGTNTALYNNTINPTSLLSYTANNLQAGGQYSIQAFDGSCYYNSSFQITLLTQPFSYSLSSNSSTICAGETLSTSIVFSNTAAAYNYQWSPTTFINNATAQNVVISPTLAPGSITTLNYSVVVTPTNANCPVTQTFNLTYIHLATPTISAIPALCDNATVYTIQVNPNGGLFYSSATNSAIGNSSGILTPSISPSGVNTFTYAITANTCEAFSLGTYTILPSPTITIAGNDTLCLGNQIQLTASGADFYSWNTGDTNSVIFISPITSSVYTVTGFNNNGNCTSVKTISVQVELCAGINEFLHATGITIYPNPTEGVVQIQTKTTTHIVICDELGRTVLKQTFEIGKHNLDLSTLPAGLYFLTTQANDDPKTIKLIKND